MAESWAGEGVSPLDGYRVAVTADRRAPDLAELLRRQGADVVLSPVIQTLPLGDEADLRRATGQLVEQAPDFLVATTGIGIRAWFGASEVWGLDDRLRAALRRAHIAARGPKAAAAIQQAGLEVWRQEGTEQLHHLVAGLIDDGLVEGRRVALQLPGQELPGTIAALEEAGAAVVAIPVYRWELPSDRAPVRRLVAGLFDGRLDAVTFTSPPAVRNFVSLSEEAGLGDPMREAFERRVVAGCVGPVTAAAAKAAGLGTPVWPERGRLGLLVRALADRLAASRLLVEVGGVEAVVQGSTLLTPNRRVALTGRERAVLEILSRRQGAVVSKARLLQEAWGSVDASPHVLEVTVARLRRRLEPVGLAVRSAPRRGYRLVAL